MADRPIPKALRRLFFVLGVGSLMAAGIYLQSGRVPGGDWARFGRAIMFLLLGLFWILMYGENRSAARSGEGGDVVHK
ncbi:MAG: hypothetical protein JXA57_17085 [Armatimonadetes bacterium]|nr:hypothetical protein [Armatimonadota bacterium]